MTPRDVPWSVTAAAAALVLLATRVPHQDALVAVAAGAATLFLLAATFGPWVWKRLAVASPYRLHAAVVLALLPASRTTPLEVPWYVGAWALLVLVHASLPRVETPDATAGAAASKLRRRLPTLLLAAALLVLPALAYLAGRLLPPEAASAHEWTSMGGTLVVAAVVVAAAGIASLAGIVLARRRAAEVQA